MHIADGIIDASICLAAHAVSIAAISIAGRKATAEEIPKMGIVGAALFVVSLIHIPIAGTAIHPGLYGLAGIILGKRAFPVIYTILLFQSLIFQHGGLLSLGVNALNMGAGAWFAWQIWRFTYLHEPLRAILAGMAGIVLPALLMALEFELSGYGKGIRYLFAVYLLLAALEGVFSWLVVKFFRRVNTNILN